MTLKVRPWLLVALPVVLSSCYWPQHYTLDVNLSRSGTVEVRFQGQLVYLLPRTARVEAAQKGKTMTAKDLSQLAAANQEALRDLKKTPGAGAVQSLGNDTFAFQMHEKKTLADGQTFKTLMDLLTVKRLGKAVTISMPKLTAKDVAQLNALHLVADGRINITTDGRVLKHNVLVSGILGKTYHWDMKGIDSPAPSMTIGLN